MRNSSSSIPLPHGSYVFHVDQDLEWVKDCPGGTARIIRADTVHAGWDYAVICAEKFNERPGLHNPFTKPGRWHSRFVRPVYPRLPVPYIIAQLDHGMKPIATMSPEALDLMADYITTMHPEAQAGLWTIGEAQDFRAGVLGSDSLQIHSMYIERRVHDLGLDFWKASDQYMARQLERKVAAGEL